MWLTQSVDLNKARAEEESCSDIRRGSSVLWAKVWVPSPCAARSVRRPGPRLPPWDHVQRGCSRNGRSAQNVSRRATATRCQVPPYFLASTDALNSIYGNLSPWALCSSQVLWNQRQASSDRTSLPGLGQAGLQPRPNLTALVHLCLRRNAHPSCGRGMFLKPWETTTCSARARSCWVHVSQVQNRLRRARGTVSRHWQYAVRSNPASRPHPHASGTLLGPAVFWKRLKLLLRINSCTQVPALGPSSSTREQGRSKLPPPK